jgi:hypothetical protein
MPQGYLFLCYDMVLYAGIEGQQSFERNSLDKNLAPFLVEKIKVGWLHTLCVVTGPGGFTNLRVGSLVCNLLAHYLPKIQFHVISKLDIYTWAVEQWYLPSQWLLYIGQQKTVRSYDFITREHILVSKEQEVSDGCFVDGIQGYFSANYSGNQAVFSIDQGVLCIQYQWCNYDCNPLLSQLKLVQTVVPAYYVQPVIG